MYGTDLAHVHNSGFGDFSESAGRAALETFAQHGLRRGTVLDLGCGGGQWLRMLTDAGFHAIGFDASPSMVRLARNAAPQAAVKVASVWKDKLPRCDAVTAFGEVLSYLPAGSARAPSLLRLFRRIHASLSDRGLFIFDMLTCSNTPPLCYRTGRAGKDWVVLVDVSEDVERCLVRRTHDVFRRTNSTYRRTSEQHVLRVVRRRDIERHLREVGFVVRTSTRYGSFEVPSRRTVFYARRR